MATIKGNNPAGTVRAVCISEGKGTRKRAVTEAVFKKDFGIIGDAHAGSHRQISLLAEESIEKMRRAGLSLGFGDFGENVVIAGIDLKGLPVGARIKIGEDVVLEISQIGKECVSKCAIYYQTGDCVMPKEGVFAKVLKEGVVKPGESAITIDRVEYSY